MPVLLLLPVCVCFPTGSLLFNKCLKDFNQQSIINNTAQGSLQGNIYLSGSERRRRKEKEGVNGRMNDVGMEGEELLARQFIFPTDRFC